MELVEFKFNDEIAYVNPEKVVYLTPVDEDNTHIQMQHQSWITVGEPIKEVASKLAITKKE